QDELFPVTKTFTLTQNPGADVFPLVRQTLSPPADCSVSFHVTNAFLAKTAGGGPALVISVDGVPLSPPSPAGWEASDLVAGDPGEEVAIEYKVKLTASPLSITEEWDKHCFQP